MRSRAVWIGLSGLFLVVGIGLVVRAQAGQYTDDDGWVHEPAINALTAQGILDQTECADGLFCPGEPMSRWTMAVWLVRALGQTPAAGNVDTRFGDVDAGLWWTPYVERLADVGVTAGCAVGSLRFCPDEPATRGQMATFLNRTFGFPKGPPAGFADAGGNVHEEGIDALASVGITSGCATDPPRFCPGAPVTRGQMATFLARALALVPRAEIPGRYTAIATGSRHACALRSNRTITCWGTDDYGTTEPPPGTYTPLSIGGLLNCALRLEGFATCWGYGDYGQTRVPAERFTAVSADFWYGCGLRPDGSLRCWGRDPWKDEPVELPGGRFTAVSVGSEHSCGL